MRDFGWTISDDGLQPVTRIGNIAPTELLKVIACNCSSDKPCSHVAVVVIPFHVLDTANVKHMNNVITATQ